MHGPGHGMDLTVPSTVRRIQQVGKYGQGRRTRAVFGDRRRLWPPRNAGEYSAHCSLACRQEREDGQANLPRISSNITQILVPSRHNLNLDAPDDVAAVIREVVESVRQRSKF